MQSPNFTVTIVKDKWAQGNLIDKNSGAYTTYIPDKSGAIVGAEIHYDPDYIASAEGQAAYLRGARRFFDPELSGITVEQVLAHEMGHAFGVFAGCQTESCANRSSLRWENTYRTPAEGVRKYHDQKRLWDWRPFRVIK
jgi:hypothetical protein